MLSDLLDFLLQVSIWGTDNEVFSKRTQRVFQGIILLFLIAFATVGVLLLYAGCDTGSGKLPGPVMELPGRHRAMPGASGSRRAIAICRPIAARRMASVYRITGSRYKAAAAVCRPAGSGRFHGGIHQLLQPSPPSG